MRAGEVGAAGLLDGFEFHELDAGQVGVVEIQLPFAVTADFRRLRAVNFDFREPRLDVVNVGYAEGDVIHDTESARVGGG